VSERQGDAAQARGAAGKGAILVGEATRRSARCRRRGPLTSQPYADAPPPPPRSLHAQVPQRQGAHLRAVPKVTVGADDGGALGFGGGREGLGWTGAGLGKVGPSCQRRSAFGCGALLTAIAAPGRARCSPLCRAAPGCPVPHSGTAGLAGPARTSTVLQMISCSPCHRAAYSMSDATVSGQCCIVPSAMAPRQRLGALLLCDARWVVQWSNLAPQLIKRWVEREGARPRCGARLGAASTKQRDGAACVDGAEREPTAASAMPLQFFACPTFEARNGTLRKESWRGQVCSLSLHPGGGPCLASLRAQVNVKGKSGPLLK
jgi:hypothetical protein